MCQCTPTIRTPFCGKPGCEWPLTAEERLEIAARERAQLLDLIDGLKQQHAAAERERDEAKQDALRLFRSLNAEHEAHHETQTELDQAKAAIRLVHQMVLDQRELLREARSDGSEAREAAHTILADVKRGRPEWLARWPWLAPEEER